MAASDTIYDHETKQVMSRAAEKRRFNFGQEPFYLVYLIIGQSVAQGGGPALTNLEVLPGEPDGPLDNLFMLSSAGSIVPAKAPTSELSPGTNLDPGYRIGQVMRARTGRTQPILIVNRAVGGTSFSENNWNPGDPEYNAAVASLAALFADTSVKCYLDGIFWIQGESDSNGATNEPRSHLPALEAMIPALRNGGVNGIPNDYFGTHEDKPFICGTINQEFSRAPIEVNCNLFQIEARHRFTAVADFRDLPYNEEGPADWHPTQQGTRQMGQRMANALDRARRNIAVGSVEPILPTYEWRVRANAGTLAFGDLELATPIENTGAGIDPQLGAVTAGGLVGGIAGFERGSVIGFAAAGFSVTNVPYKPEGYTYAMWVYPNAVAANMPMVAPAVFKTGGTADDPGWLFRLDHVPDGDATIAGSLQRAFGVRIQHDDLGAYVSPPLVFSNRWTHIAVTATYQESGVAGTFSATLVLFVNGVYAGSAAQAPIQDANAPLNSGCHIGITATEYAGSFQGFMDEVTHWPAPLSQTQVVRHMRDTMSGHTTKTGTGGGPTGLLS